MKKTFITILILSLPFVSWGQIDPNAESTEPAVENNEKLIEPATMVIVGEEIKALPKNIIDCRYRSFAEVFESKEAGVEILRPMEGTGTRTSGSYLRNTPRR
ncbi:hypothetical protein [Phaeocystidibacter luteus]|uniref:Uncharacterized protein n=1 Tax=Phaeocystidibacter luteus TaxID=911197 RepID=A0A6N6RGQ3_9FLAO|nr:hypothetical protein [Phaeocystidibacter luteus]KAB2808655.1 hypothetical protein F8C67_10235 [Phaeocystidibacter luteus]